MINGIINVYKEKDYTSFDVVAILRKKLNIKKIGHTGTLDPMAEGVLPICIGKATKAVDYLVDKQKTYKTTMKLGIKTDTQDATGKIIEIKSVDLKNEEITEAIKSFIGLYKQTPPMYSAIKINGKRLYELARKGETIERKPREITIYDINNIKINNENIDFNVVCSKGTYIRTLCYDIGEKLRCGGHMTELTREKSGDFTIENSYKLGEIDTYIKECKLRDIIIDIDKIYSKLPKIIVNPNFNKVLYNGNKLKQDYLINSSLETNKNYRVYDNQNNFIGIYNSIYNDTIVLKPITLFI